MALPLLVVLLLHLLDVSLPALLLLLRDTEEDEEELPLDEEELLDLWPLTTLADDELLSLSLSNCKNGGIS